ncbi:hypothetical protein HYS84_03985 [Candidatus Saccharibacteria bacterium]|nr:hypothetical protein [Candidatus Saccharibacteria bacterium]
MQNQPVSSGPVDNQRPKRRVSLGVKFMRAEVFTVLLGVALLLVAVALYAGLASPGSESKEINSKEYQAVFLSNGQVYFGKITDLNNKYLVLKSVFYIENNTSSSDATQTQNSNYTLRKLGTTELHAPQDKMVVNRDTVTFWENLKDSSQVVTKINEYYKNPDAANTTPSNSTDQSPSTPQTNTTPTTNIAP